MNRPANVAVFIPHIGCPHRCSFCNQHSISGALKAPTPEDVAVLLRSAAQSLGERMQSAQIAFFGGSFTAIDYAYQRVLLNAIQPFLGNGGFSGVRISTRPDCIDQAVLKELWDAGVRAIELGVQSMDDRVLGKNRRGHTAKEVADASRLIRHFGFSLGHQMMTGLPGDTDEGAMETARRLAELEPETMRIYPALVLRDTELSMLYEKKQYRPVSLEQSVDLCARLLDFFLNKGIRVIRLGLHSDPALEGQVLSGPYHPAFRELCEGKLMMERSLRQIRRDRLTGAVALRVHPGSLSKMIGQKKCNLNRLRELGYLPQMVPDSGLGPLEVLAEPIPPA